MTDHSTSSIREAANEYIVALSAEAAECEDIDDLTPVGIYTKAFLGDHEGVVNDESVEAFMLGVAAANLVYQETLVRVMLAAGFMQDDAPDEEHEDFHYGHGSNDAAEAASEIAGENLPGVVRMVIESPLYERAFKSIIDDM